LKRVYLKVGFSTLVSDLELSPDYKNKCKE
jgi:hypothetical protein